MIANTFEVLAQQLDAYFKAAPSRSFGGTTVDSIPGNDNDPSLEIVSFLEQKDRQEFIKFSLNKVTPILINIEEEKMLRTADRYAKTSPTGIREQAFPNIRLNLNILFVSNFYDYTDSLYYMGLMINFFQSKPVFDHRNTPGLHQGTDKLILELITQSIAEQNEVWNGLRTAYHPSLLYKAKMLVFQDQPAPRGSGEVITVQTIHETT